MRPLAAAAGAAQRKIRGKGKKGGKNLDKGRRKSCSRPTVRGEEEEEAEEVVEEGRKFLWAPISL